MRTLRNLPAYLLLSLVALVIIFPFLYALSVSLMTPAEVTSWPPQLWPAHAQWSNYRDVLSIFPAGRFLWNSFFVAASVTVGQLIVSGLAGFAFAFIKFPGRKWIFGLFLATMMVPFELTLIPNYLLVSQLKWINKYPALIVPFVATAFGTFLMRQFFQQIPRDLEDAATIDGCSRLRFFWSVALPLTRPGMVTLGVYAFLTTWNQYLWPLLVTNAKEMRTVQIGVRFLSNQEAQHWELVMSGVIMVLIPALLLLLVGYRYLVRGLMAGAVKG